MATVSDVAAYILKKAGPMTAMKLQKLVYYGQAWSLVWDEKELFPEPIQAWANGPVCPDLYRLHQGRFNLSPGDIAGDPKSLTKDERETVEAILEHYGKRPAQWLSDLTHRERPWRNARKGLADGERGSNTISHAAMVEYYGGLE